MIDQAKVREIIADAVPGIDASAIDEASTFDSNNIDSLDQMSIIMGIQEATGKQIPDEDIDKLTSILAICDYINK